MARATARCTGSAFSSTLAAVERSLCLRRAEALRALRLPRLEAPSVYLREESLLLERPRPVLDLPAEGTFPSGVRARPELLLPPAIEFDISGTKGED